MPKILYFKIARYDKATGKAETVARLYPHMRKEAELLWDTLRYVSQGNVESNAYYQAYTYTFQEVYAGE